MSRRFNFGINLIMVAIVAAIALSAVFGLDRFRSRHENAQPEEIRKALLDACVQCYALEGSYPPDLEYLKEHYGVILDENKYYYYYEAFASNVIPEVEVYGK